MRAEISIVLIGILVLVSGCIAPPECGNSACDLGEGIPESPSYCPSDCGQNYHAACVEEKCARVIGAGEDSCSADAECVKPAHLECESERCVSVEGEGADSCASDFDCRPETHFECRNRQCAEVTGSGTNQCQTDTQCEIINEKFCVSNVVSADLIEECMNTLTEDYPNDSFKCPGVIAATNPCENIALEGGEQVLCYWATSLEEKEEWEYCPAGCLNGNCSCLEKGEWDAGPDSFCCAGLEAKEDYKQEGNFACCGPNECAIDGKCVAQGYESKTENIICSAGNWENTQKLSIKVLDASGNIGSGKIVLKESQNGNIIGEADLENGVAVFEGVEARTYFVILFGSGCAVSPCIYSNNSKDIIFDGKTPITLRVGFIKPVLNLKVIEKDTGEGVLDGWVLYEEHNPYSIVGKKLSVDNPQGEISIATEEARQYTFKVYSSEEREKLLEEFTLEMEVGKAIQKTITGSTCVNTCAEDEYCTAAACRKA